jgi:hypothetical protein
MLSNTLAAEWIKMKIMTYTVFSFKVVNAVVIHGDAGGGILKVTGLIHDLPTVADLMECIAGEAEEICSSINGRMESKSDIV